MRLRLLLDDLRDLPMFLRMGSALRQASADGRETLGVLIRQQAERIPNRVLLRFENETVTFGEYNCGVNSFAAVFAQAGVSRGEPLALMMENSPSLLMAQGAAAKIGAVAALLNTHLSGKSLSHVLKTSGARHVFVDAACLQRMVEVPEAVTFTIWGQGESRTLPPHVEPLDAAVAAAPTHEPTMPDLRGRDVFLYIYTSGTTGYPKAAIVRHTRFTMAGLGLSALLGIGADDVIYAPLPLYHGESNFVGFSVAMRTGGCFASRRRFSASEFLDDVRRHGATAFVYVGELCRYLLNQPESPHDRDHKLRLAVGAGLRPDIWERFQKRFGIERIVEMYGATEGNVSLMNRSGRPGSVGRAHPFQHHLLRLARYDFAKGELARDSKGRLIECGVDEPGELLGKIASGATMPFDGYSDSKANETKLVRDAFRRGDAYFRSGDILRRDAEYYYYFVDRVGDTFRWKGENVATQEVAEFLNGVPGIAETNVYGVELRPFDGRAGMAAVVLVPGERFDPDSFYSRAEQLPAYARPVFVRVLASMDVTGTLKQRKIELQSEGYDPNVVRDPLYVRDDNQKLYVPLTAQLLEQLRAGTLRV
ncbi:MAG TPA: long-chain-acyl-CoA synthetase [Candidatus Acidoferrales bacterium]|nr:long-chain-acyl-CoA synthetase [Candidatus Acidoferrales bacterium]